MTSVSQGANMLQAIDSEGKTVNLGDIDDSIVDAEYDEFELSE